MYMYTYIYVDLHSHLKREEYLITFKSRSNANQIEVFLTRKTKKHAFKNLEVKTLDI